MINTILIHNLKVLVKEKLFKRSNKGKNIILKAPKMHFNFGSYGLSWTSLFCLVIVSPALEQNLTCGGFDEHAKVIRVIYLWALMLDKWMSTCCIYNIYMLICKHLIHFQFISRGFYFTLVPENPWRVWAQIIKDTYLDK